ncbi:hypothetical protein B0A50_00425 [Salinomyces thailandicus]|uniref:SH3 domain-containing protein n=1 Tax=Salinomyces thailandicus TaxID=706561 RepID=A0A4V5N606_9PEZI|nr:hypothetical protein B0A50_00425 [Salinomyces thailandica]
MIPAAPSLPARRSKRRKTSHFSNVPSVVATLLASSIPTAIAQNCISLAGSTQCGAFNASAISTNSNLTGLFPFLSDVTDTASFDSQLQTYISSDFTQRRYANLLGCENVNLDNTTAFYARYTTSVLCNAIIQNSIDPCGLTGDATRPLCADSCASYAESEQEITSSDVCGTASDDALTQIRADFTNCALPADSLTGSCIEGVDNEPNDCGYGNNTGSLCECEGVTLPIIAGVAVGSVLGALLLLGLLVFGCLFFRRRQASSPATSVFNQPSPTRQKPPMAMAYNDGARDQERAGTALMPGGRVARMSALEGSGSSEYGRSGYTPAGVLGDYRNSASDEEYTPQSRDLLGVAANAPPKRSGSLSSGSQLALPGAEDTSPSSGNDQYTSPESQAPSEQLGFFKDYYSQDEIHPGDLVSTLWAYEPRAADEFQLERGDMIKVLGIWDDGWATGVRVRQKADDWRPEGKVQRDSGMTNGSTRPSGSSRGEVKAFPLVCVCAPPHWRKTIEGDSTEGSGPPQGYPELP